MSGLKDTKKLRDTLVIITTIATMLITFFCIGMIAGITKWEYPGIYIFMFISWIWNFVFVSVNIPAFRRFIRRHNSK